MAKETIAILGGTGDLGTGLAIRWAKAGHAIIIGSRTQEKADAAVAELKKISPQTPAKAMVNSAAAAAGDIVVLTVPFEHQLSTLESVRDGLQGKILIDVTVPLIPPKVGTVQLPPEGSAGKRAQNYPRRWRESRHRISKRRGASAATRREDRMRRAGCRQQQRSARQSGGTRRRSPVCPAGMRVRSRTRQPPKR